MARSTIDTTTPTIGLSVSDASCGPAAGTCLVAVDGSEASVHALVWSLRHATEHDMRVEVLTVWPPHRSILVHEVPGHFCAPRWRARTAQAEVVGRALERVPDQPIIATTLENGRAVDAIVRASARHDLVVLGSNSQDPWHRLTDRIIEDALCEVVVVDTAGQARRQPIGPPAARLERTRLRSAPRP